MTLEYKNINGHEILTSQPNPYTNQWQAITRDYEPSAPFGTGETEQEAIDDLMDQLEELS